jgi:hypothetical protein
VADVERRVYRFESELWLWDGQAAWHFVTLPGDVSDDVRARADAPRGFGSVRVRVAVGTTTWSTSVFPDAQRGAYLLPVKKEVRVREGLELGQPVRVQLELL